MSDSVAWKEDGEEEEEHHVIPRSCSGKLTAFLLSVVPAFGVIAMSTAWFRTTRQTMENAELRSALIHHQTLQIARLIIDFNYEREMTAIYVTARTERTQAEAAEALRVARGRIDHALTQLLVWPSLGAHSGAGGYPPGPPDDQMFRSPFLFAAILARHRSAVKPGSSYFWDEIQYYTDVMDVLMGLFHRSVSHPGGGGDDTGHGGRRLWQLLTSYGYLLGAVSYIGAEQALCSVFHAVVCFSHRETFYYANYSFAGEALFRLYRQSYPGEEGEGDWRTAPHRSFFPELDFCRREILADLDHAVAMTTDPTACSYGRKNETRFAEVDRLTALEAQRLTGAVLALVGAETAARRREAWIGAGAVTSAVCYVVVAHVIRCVIVGCAGVRKIRRKRREKSAKSQVVVEPLSVLRHQRTSDLTNDYYSVDKAPPVEAYGYHRSTMDGSNPCDGLKFSLENCTCSNHTSPSKSVALKVASV